MTASASIFNRLSTDGTVGPLVTNGGSPATYRIYPVNMPQDVTYPAIRYQHITNRPIDNIIGESTLTNDQVQFDCYAETFDAAHTLANAVNTAMTGSSTGFKARRINRLDLPFESGLNIFRVMMEYSIWY